MREENNKRDKRGRYMRRKEKIVEDERIEENAKLENKITCFLLFLLYF